MDISPAHFENCAKISEAFGNHETQGPLRLVPQGRLSDLFALAREETLRMTICPFVFFFLAIFLR
jgi:hypothetical protein